MRWPSTKCHCGWGIESELQEGKVGSMVVKKLDRSGSGYGTGDSSVCWMPF